MKLRFGVAETNMFEPSKNDEIVFVEVKTVSKEQLGSPELKIDTEKISKLEKSIDSYLMKNEVHTVSVATLELTKNFIKKHMT